MKPNTIPAYPLAWPAMHPRTLDWRRKSAKFKTSLGDARDDLVRELGRLGARNVVVSTNVQVRRDGLLYASATEPRDPGVAVYFDRVRMGVGTFPYVIACDTYTKLRANLRAIGATVEALRTIERHGSSQMLEQAFTGFAALPPASSVDDPWWTVLGVASNAGAAEVLEAYRKLALAHHPDRGGDHATMARINRARAQALGE